MNGSPIQPCPYLPEVGHRWSSADMRELRAVRDAAFFEAVLRYGQSRVIEGKPAQALLQLNRALSVEPRQMPDAERLPYRAKLWILAHPGDGFLGNPVRHYQHLATRVNEPARELRSWRAWACFHLAERLLRADEFPRDRLQIERESLSIPAWSETLTRLKAIGAGGEDELLRQLMNEISA